MPGLEGYDCEGVLNLNSISMNNRRWAITADENGGRGLLQLLTLVNLRGENRLIPHSTGVIAYPKRLNSIRLDFRLVVCGDYGPSDEPRTDIKAALAENLDYLYDNVVSTVHSGDGTIEAEWISGMGAVGTRAGAVQVLGLVDQGYWLDGGLWDGTLQLEVIGGRLT